MKIARIARIALIGPFLVGVWMNVQAASFADDVGPYLRAEGGFSKARDAGFRDNDPNSADCFLIATVPGNCNGGVLNHLGNGFYFGAGWVTSFREEYAPISVSITVVVTI
jgi:hypothetical protein